MLKELQTNLKTIENNPEIRVVILSATGPVFSSGHDLQEIQINSQCDLENNKNASLMELCSKVMQTIVRLRQPVIAQVEGIATAAGCQLVASCDLAYASNSARFATPGVNIGLFCSTPAVALGRSVHRKHAMEMLLTGDMISATKAERIGLINGVIGDEDGKDRASTNNLDDAVLEIATKIASKSPKAIELGKSLFYQQLELPLNAAYQLTSKAMVDHLDQKEAKEGIEAFLTKRMPNWSSTDWLFCH